MSYEFQSVVLLAKWHLARIEMVFVYIASISYHSLFVLAVLLSFLGSMPRLLQIRLQAI